MGGVWKKHNSVKKKKQKTSRSDVDKNNQELCGQK